MTKVVLKMGALAVGVILLGGWLNAQWSKDDARQEIPAWQRGIPYSSDPQVILNRISTYMIKDSVLYQQLSWDEEGLSIYRSPGAKDSGIVETKVYWDEGLAFNCSYPGSINLEGYLKKGTSHLPPSNCFPTPPTPLPSANTKQLPLDGYKIAIDPGHVGGSMKFARLEKKFVWIKAGNRPEVTQPVIFNEGNLVLGTALMLRDTLEKLGATVLLTREREGDTAFDIPFSDWCKQQADSAEAKTGLNWKGRNDKTSDGFPARWRKGVAWNYCQQEDIHGKDSLWWMTEATMRDIYRIPFLKADFKKRAEEINTFNPHFTLILHYNVWEKNTWNSGKYLNAIDDNYTMAFIPGSFMSGELKRPEDRMTFLRKAFNNDIEESERLSTAVVKAFEKHLSIPAIPYDTSLRYLRAASIPTQGKGVFARNLSLTRLIDGPLCFGEALYQDNIDECLRLNEKDILLPGMKTRLPNRLRDVVNAYVEGALDYVGQH